MLLKIDSILQTEYPNDRLSAITISSKLHLSRSQLHRKLKLSHGLSTTEYIQNYRIDRACEMLLASNKNIKTIGFNCGFNSASWFHQVFKKIKGMSPTQYRKANMQQ